MGAFWLARGYYIHLYSHKLQLQKEEIEKKSKELYTQRVKEHNVPNAY